MKVHKHILLILALHISVSCTAHSALWAAQIDWTASHMPCISQAIYRCIVSTSSHGHFAVLSEVKLSILKLKLLNSTR